MTNITIFYDLSLIKNQYNFIAKIRYCIWFTINIKDTKRFELAG